MTIVVKPAAVNDYPLYAYDIEDVKAYESESGLVYIGNYCSGVIAFSLDGKNAVPDGSAVRFRAIKLTCEIEAV